MDQNLNEEVGVIKISEDVVGVIAGIAANEVKGIKSLNSAGSKAFAKLSGKKNISSGVKVEFTEDKVSINLYVIVQYGLKITEEAKKIQDNVKKTVEAMTGLTVDKVNVNVQDIVLPDIVTDSDTIEE